MSSGESLAYEMNLSINHLDLICRSSDTYKVVNHVAVFVAEGPGAGDAELLFNIWPFATVKIYSMA